MIDQKIHKGDNRPFDFEIESFRKECLLNGYDDIALTLKKDAKISIWSPLPIEAFDDDRTCCKTVRMLVPDAFTNGGDQNNESIPEAPVCKEIG